MPKEINGYRIVEKAQGGMAVVYKGMNSSGFCRAFKVVRPDKAVNNPALCQRFLKGIQILKSLDHPNIIKALNAFMLMMRLEKRIPFLRWIGLMEWI